MSKYSDTIPDDISAALGWLLEYINPNTTLLDFGCSTGYFGSYLKNSKSINVYGVEISEDAKEAKKVLDGVYSFDLDNDWPTSVFERKYDYLFFGDVLEHLKNPGEVLAKAKKLLKPNGLVFVSIPNIAHLSIRLELMSGGFLYEPVGILDDTHLKYFTYKTFKTIAETAGYSVKALDYSINDIPKSIAKALLDKAGLQAKSKFWKISETKEARAYQYKFVLVAKSANAKEPVANIKALPPKPLQHRDSYIDEIKNQADAMKKHADSQARMISDLQSDKRALEAERDLAYERLDKVLKSLPGRIIKLASKTKAKLKRSK